MHYAKVGGGGSDVLGDVLLDKLGSCIYVEIALTPKHCKPSSALHGYAVPSFRNIAKSSKC